MLLRGTYVCAATRKCSTLPLSGQRRHSEMARYGTLIAWVQATGHDDIVRLLNTNPNEERQPIESFRARRSVNRKAASYFTQIPPP
jgi:ferritin-like metal-binding protein YciE